MTEQDREQVREALTDAALSDAIDAWWDAGALHAMRDRLLAALAPLVRPAPPTACVSELCQFAGPHAVTECCPTAQEDAAFQRGLSLGRAERPSTPEGSAER